MLGRGFCTVPSIFPREIDKGTTRCNDKASAETCTIHSTSAITGSLHAHI